MVVTQRIRPDLCLKALHLLLGYIELVDCTGRAILDDKRGAIPADTPKIFERLNIC